MRGFLIAVFALIVSAPMAFAGDLVVIAATNAGDGFKPGTVLADGIAIELPDGARLTLISQAGTVATIDGPFSGIPGGDGKNAGAAKASGATVALAKIADAVSGRKAQTSVAGVVRAATPGTTAARAAGIWPLNVDSSGPRCLLGSSDHLWRRDPSPEVTVALRGEGGRALGLTWKAGEKQLAIPSDIIGGGDRLAISLHKTLRRFVIHVLPASIAPDRYGAVLDWLITVGCKRQAYELIDILHSGLDE